MEKLGIEPDTAQFVLKLGLSLAKEKDVGEMAVLVNFYLHSKILRYQSIRTCMLEKYS